MSPQLPMRRRRARSLRARRHSALQNRPPAGATAAACATASLGRELEEGGASVTSAPSPDSLPTEAISTEARKIASEIRMWIFDRMPEEARKFHHEQGRFQASHNNDLYRLLLESQRAMMPLWARLKELSNELRRRTGAIVSV